MIPLTFEEALARLADGDPLTVRIDHVPNNGVTMVQVEARDFCIARLHNNPVYESGIMAQNADLGINIITIGEHIGLINVFFPTKPECRLTEEQLAQSVKRKHGAPLFSTKAQAE